MQYYVAQIINSRNPRNIQQTTAGMKIITDKICISLLRLFSDIRIKIIQIASRNSPTVAEGAWGILPAFGQPVAKSRANGPKRFAILPMMQVLILM